MLGFQGFIVGNKIDLGCFINETPRTLKMKFLFLCHLLVQLKFVLLAHLYIHLMFSSALLV